MTLPIIFIVFVRKQLQTIVVHMHCRIDGCNIYNYFAKIRSERNCCFIFLYFRIIIVSWGVNILEINVIHEELGRCVMAERKAML